MKKPDYPLTVISTEWFSYKDKVFASEASTIEANEALADIEQLMRQIYKDACDLGFYLFNKATGRQQLFTLQNADLNNGDIAAWYFVPADISLRECGVRLVVFND